MENLGLWENTLVSVTSAQTDYEKVPLWMYFQKRFQPKNVSCDVSNVQIHVAVLEYLSFRVSEHSIASALEDDICESQIISSSFQTQSWYSTPLSPREHTLVLGGETFDMYERESKQAARRDLYLPTKFKKGFSLSYRYETTHFSSKMGIIDINRTIQMSLTLFSRRTIA